MGPRRAVLAIVTKGKRKRKQAEVEQSMDLAGETKPFLLGVPDFFMKYGSASTEGEEEEGGGCTMSRSFEERRTMKES